MRSIAFRIGTKGEGGAAGYPLSLFVGDDADVIRQLTDGSAPVASDVIPSDLAGMRKVQGPIMEAVRRKAPGNAS